MDGLSNLGETWSTERDSVMAACKPLLTRVPWDPRIPPEVARASLNYI